MESIYVVLFVAKKHISKRPLSRGAGESFAVRGVVDIGKVFTWLENQAHNGRAE